MDRWRERDPLELLAARLGAAGLLSDDARAALDEQVGQEVEDAVAFAEAAPIEDVDQLERFVLSDSSSAGRHRSAGT